VRRRRRRRRRTRKRGSKEKEKRVLQDKGKDDETAKAENDRKNTKVSQKGFRVILTLDGVPIKEDVWI